MSRCRLPGARTVARPVGPPSERPPSEPPCSRNAVPAFAAGGSAGTTPSGAAPAAAAPPVLRYAGGVDNAVGATPAAPPVLRYAGGADNRADGAGGCGQPDKWHTTCRRAPPRCATPAGRRCIPPPPHRPHRAAPPATAPSPALTIPPQPLSTGAAPEGRCQPAGRPRIGPAPQRIGGPRPSGERSPHRRWQRGPPSPGSRRGIHRGRRPGRNHGRRVPAPLQSGQVVDGTTRRRPLVDRRSHPDRGLGPDATRTGPGPVLVAGGAGKPAVSAEPSRPEPAVPWRPRGHPCPSVAAGANLRGMLASVPGDQPDLMPCPGDWSWRSTLRSA